MPQLPVCGGNQAPPVKSETHQISGVIGLIQNIRLCKHGQLQPTSPHEGRGRTDLGQIDPADEREVVVLDVVADVESDQVEGSIVAETTRLWPLGRYL